MIKTNHSGELIETDKMLSLEEVLNKYHNIFLDRYIANELDLEYHKRIKDEDPKRVIMEGYDRVGNPIKTPINELIMRYLLGLQNNLGYLGVITDLIIKVREKSGQMLHSYEEIDQEIKILQEEARKPAIIISTEGPKRD